MVGRDRLYLGGMSFLYKRLESVSLNRVTKGFGLEKDEKDFFFDVGLVLEFEVLGVRYRNV